MGQLEFQVWGFGMPMGGAKRAAEWETDIESAIDQADSETALVQLEQTLGALQKRARSRLSASPASAVSGRVLVTGGSGLVGTAIRSVLECTPDLGHGLEWVYLSSKDCDLRDRVATVELFRRKAPTHIIHLAADVGGLYKNLNQQCQLLENNLLINTSVLHAAKQVGVRHLIAVLSTCIMPDGIVPVSEKQMHSGPPHHSNEGYAHAKRVMEVQVRRMRDQYHLPHWYSVIPCNLYGPGDQFDIQDAHVIAGLIHKAHLCQTEGKPFVVWGTGSPLRQFVYSDDFARVLLRYLNPKFATDATSLIVAPPTENSIKEIATLVANEFGLSQELKFDTSKTDGQHRKTAVSSHFESCLPNFQFTPIEAGLHETVKWFKANLDKACRKRAAGL